MLLGTSLGLGGLYFLLRGRDRRNLSLAALLPALFWLAQAGSFYFPGTGGLDSEFDELVPKVNGTRVNERFSSGALLLGLSLGLALALQGGAESGDSAIATTRREQDG
jgi:hypothetical protein